MSTPLRRLAVTVVAVAAALYWGPSRLRVDAAPMAQEQRLGTKGFNSSVAIDPTDDAHVVAAAHDATGFSVRETFDGGANWTATHFAGGNPKVAFTAHGDVFVTYRDSGGTTTVYPYVARKPAGTSQWLVDYVDPGFSFTPPFYRLAKGDIFPAFAIDRLTTPDNIVLMYNLQFDGGFEEYLQYELTGDGGVTFATNVLTGV